MSILHVLNFKRIKLATSLLFIVVALVGEFRKPKFPPPQIGGPKWPRR